MKLSSAQIEIDQIKKETFAVHTRVGRLTTPWHTHEVHKLLYAEEGVLHLQTEQSQILLPIRHGAWIPYNCPHRVYSPSPDLFWRTLYFKPEAEEAAILTRLHIFPLSNLAREMILYTQRWDSAIETNPIEHSFFQTIRLMLPDWCQNSLFLMLPSTEHPQLAPIIAHLHEDLAEPLYLETVARQYGFSGRTLLRLFKRELKMTFGAYLRVARIIRSLELLTQPNASVTQVAHDVGYDSPSAFSQTFQQLVGVRPQLYLKRRN